jgi:hypothetical protein
MRTEIEKQKKSGKSCTLSSRRERKKKKARNDHRRQSDHHTSSRITPCKRGHGSASKETVEGQVWSSGGVERAA